MLATLKKFHAVDMRKIQLVYKKASFHPNASDIDDWFKEKCLTDRQAGGGALEAGFQ